MNLSATIAKMKACGMSADAIVMALECIVLDEPMDAQAERRRAADRERKAQKRDEERLRKSADSADNPSPLVPPFPPAPPIPPIIPPTRSNLLSGPALEARLREAAGWQHEPHPALFVTGCIETLLANGADLELDVLPVIRGRAPKVRRPSGWTYFVPAIQDAQAARSNAATGPPSNAAKSQPPQKSFEELAKELLPGWNPGPKLANSIG